MKINKYISESVTKYLNEVSFYTYTIENILTDKFIDDYVNSHNVKVLSKLVQDYTRNRSITLSRVYQIKNTKRFKKYVKEALFNNLTESFKNIYDHIDQSTNKIKLYRKMTVKKDWLEHLEQQGKRLGIYWTWNKDSATAYCSNRRLHDEAVIEIEIDEKYINWEDTFKMNMSPVYSGENEIRLFKNTTFNIKSLEINCEEVDISFIKDKTFYA